MLHGRLKNLMPFLKLSKKLDNKKKRRDKTLIS